MSVGVVACEEGVLAACGGKASAAESPRPLIHSFAAGATLGIFAELFPGAKFLFCVRDVRGAAASLLARDWSDPRTGQRFAYTLDAAAAADFWASYNKLARPCVRGLAKAGRLSIVRYEDLCERPGRTLSTISDFLAIAPIAKVIAVASDRASAISRLREALRSVEILGPTTNRDFLLAPNELLDRFAGVLNVIAFEQGYIEQPFAAVVERMCAIGSVLCRYRESVQLIFCVA